MGQKSKYKNEIYKNWEKTWVNTSNLGTVRKSLSMRFLYQIYAQSVTLQCLNSGF